MNFLEETLNEIKDSGHIPSDIIFIGSQQSGYQCDWIEFVGLADFEYDSGYGSQKIAHDLIVVFSDSHQLRRDEYDGSECWEHLIPFQAPKNRKKIKYFHSNEYPSGSSGLAVINDEEKEEC